MASAKPTIILVHGAWHNAHHLRSFVERLEEAGFKCITPDLPSVGGDPPIPNGDQDVQTIREAILSVINKGDNCVVGLHSYAGIPGSSALEGLGKNQRAQNGLKAGVIGLIYLPAWVLPKNQSLVGMRGGYPPTWDVQVS
jgi:pimeloyl-ACP methyl ester carboxylesterase